MNFNRSPVGRAVGLAAAFIACVVLVVACTGEPETKPSNFSIGGSSMVKGFTPTPTAAIREQATSGEHGNGVTVTPSQPAAGGTPPPDGPGTVTISTVGNNLEFDKQTVSLMAGSISVTLKNNATSASLQHNFVVAKKGSEDAVANAGLTAGPSNNWVAANDPNVIAHSKLVAGGSSGTFTFTAAVGSYSFICTFPGHTASMKGAFEVK